MSRNPAETPLMRQYLDIKDKYPDAVLFFRLGDFYEMFFEDAVLGARLLDLTLTTRDKGRDDAVPMCGVPHHAARGYIAKLTDLGHKVVLCEQVEDPKLAKGLVKREVVRIITPGIVLDDEVLDPKLPRYVVALVPASKQPARPKPPAFALGTSPGLGVDTVRKPPKPGAATGVRGANDSLRDFLQRSEHQAERTRATADSGEPDLDAAAATAARDAAAGADPRSRGGVPDARDHDARERVQRASMSSATTERPYAHGPGTDELCGIAFLDATTGELAATELPMSALVDELTRIAPREIICAPELLPARGPIQTPESSPKRSRLGPLRARFKCAWNAAPVPELAAARDVLGPLWRSVEAATEGPSSGLAWARGTVSGERVATTAEARAAGDLDDHPLAARAAAAVVAYARATQPAGALPLVRLRLYAPGDSVVIDEAAIANLELVETMIGKRRQGSLLEVIDETATAPGGRLLRRWLLYPLVDVAQIRRRQDAVAWLVERPTLCETIRRALSRLPDLERLAGKATLGVATPRDLGRLRDALAQLPDLIELVRSGHDAFSAIGWGSLDSRGDSRAITRDESVALQPLPGLLDLRACAHSLLPALAARLATSLVDDPPAMVKDGGVIREGLDATVDECRRLADGGKDEILGIEEREQKLSGIANLKVRYNRVFGYYIEVTKTHLTKVPGHYIRKQTIATGERYVTPELAELERRVIAAEETLAQREAELFRAEVVRVAEAARAVSAAGAALAVLDVSAALAQVAAKRGYTRPTVDDGLALDIVDGRHPVIESILPDGTFVPNDCRLDPDAEQLVLITGPNMAGKSTYMRQVAQIALLAQIGSFVPAKSATIGICDRVFTRVGAADDLSRGDSTFMVEMRETASILSKATRRSLVVLDEVGRGTSTFDGVSIAWAVGEYLHDAIGARTLFATHYHELVALAETRSRVRNVSVAVREHKGEIVFLRRVVPGGANKSYGVDVARLAGLPRTVIARAREVMARLEGSSQQLAVPPQLSLLGGTSVTPIAARLAAIEIDRTTPLEALQLLAELKALSRST